MIRRRGAWRRIQPTLPTRANLHRARLCNSYLNSKFGHMNAGKIIVNANIIRRSYLSSRVERPGVPSKLEKKNWSQFGSLLWASRSNCNISLTQLVSNFYELKRTAESIPSVTLYNALIDLCIKNHAFETAEKIFESLVQDHPKDLTQASFNMFITGYGRAGNTLLALQWFEKMRNCGIEPDLIMYSTLVHICGKNNQTEKAVQFFEEMKFKGHKPNRIVYSSLIDAYGKLLQYDKAVFYFNQMVSEDISPNIITYTSMISLCGKMKQIEKAVHLYEEMKKAGEYPDSAVLSSLVNACAGSGRIKQAWSYIEEGKLFLEASDRTVLYNSLLGAFKIRGDFEAASECFIKMKSDGTPPDKVTYLTLLGIAKKAKKLDKALELFEEMKKTTTKPDLVIVNELIDTAGKCRKPDIAHKLFSEIELTTGSKPDARSWNSFITALNHNMMEIEAEKTFNRMPVDLINLYSLTTHLTTLIRLRKHNEIMAHWKHMKNSYSNLSVHAYVSMLHYLRKKDDKEGVEQVAKEMQSCGYVLDKYCAEALIELFPDGRYSYLRRSAGLMKKH